MIFSLYNTLNPEDQETIRTHRLRASLAHWLLKDDDILNALHGVTISTWAYDDYLMISSELVIVI